MSRVFLSYSRRDDGRHGLVKVLIDDLVDEIVRITGWPDREVVYRDVHVPLGEDWSATLLDALRTCDVFVPLLSPLYLLSEYCGKEWWLFERRVRRHVERYGSRPPVVIPILWEAPSEQFVVPEVVRRIQYLDRDTAGAYGGTGLRRLVAHPGRGEKERYVAAVHLLAGRIAAVADRRALDVGDEEWDIAAAKNAFERPDNPPPAAVVS